MVNSAADVYNAYRDADNETENAGIREVVQVFNNNIHPITPIEFESLRDWSQDMSCEKGHYLP